MSVQNLAKSIENGKNVEMRKKEGFIKKYNFIIYPSSTIVLLVLFYVLVKEIFDIPSYILPSISEIFTSFLRNVDQIWVHTMVTTGEILLGFLLSIAGGTLIAILIYYFKTFELAVYPLLVISQAIPKAAIAPLFIVWMGFGLSPKILVAFLIAFFPIVVDTVVGLRSIPPEMLHLVRSMGSSNSQIFRKILLPNALPNIFAGFKVAITLAVSGAIIGEFVGADKGLGYLLLVANGQMQTDLLFTGIAILSIIGMVLFYLVVFLEKLFIPWHVSNRN